jgi:hypothetical protein
MNPKSSLTLSKLAEALQTMHVQVTEFASHSSENAADDSMFLSDFAGYMSAEAIMTLLSQANMILSAAGDHIFAMATLLRVDNDSMGVWTCARGAIEACALVAWRLDPQAGTKRRVQRSVAMRLEDLGQQQRFANAAGKIEDAKRTGTRIAKIRSDAIAHGLYARPNKKTRNKGSGLEMPDITKLINQEFGTGLVYKILSASSHMTISFMQKLNYDRTTQKVVIGEGQRSVQIHIPTRGLQPDAIGLICIETAKAYAKANWNRAELLGLDRESLAKILNHSYDDLQINNKLRFWAAA